MKLFDIIKFEGPNDALVWKHPAEDFNTGSTLIVHESQEAIFFKNGQIADIFTAGKHILKTENLPILRKFVNFPTDGVSPFHCEVYFVNKVEAMAIKWGTDSKVEFIEPTYNFPMSLGASGEMSLQIASPASFLTRLVGTEDSITPNGLVRYFRALLMSRIKSYLARTIKEQQLNIFEIDSQLDVLSDAIRSKLVADFEQYGVSLKQFFISTVVRPEDDPGYRKLKDIQAHRYTDVFEAQTRQQTELIRAQTEAQTRIMQAQSIAEKRRLEGYTYQDERGFDVAEKMAANEGTGQFANLGIGMGMMAGVGGVMGGTVGNMVGGAMNSVIQPQPPAEAPVVTPTPEPTEAAPAATAQRTCSCGALLSPGAKFCSECGAKLSPLCPNCGQEISNGAKFCPECGTKQ